ncbi:MAG: stress response translation initiation inhibitor YciH [Candidatus Aenigmatarchaeota archaeon]
MTVCKVCGLPKELCVCGKMAKEEAKIKVYSVKRSYGKWVTIVEGVEKDSKDIAKKLKSQLACGGTFKEGKIELQGNHKEKVKGLLIRYGFPAEKIEVE